MVFADESKMRFRDHRNKQIDIEWVFRGDASEANWHEEPRHCTQINLFIVITRQGILMYDLYDKNMTKAGGDFTKARLSLSRPLYKESRPFIHDVN